MVKLLNYGLYVNKFELLSDDYKCIQTYTLWSPLTSPTIGYIVPKRFFRKLAMVLNNPWGLIYRLQRNQTKSHKVLLPSDLVLRNTVER